MSKGDIAGKDLNGWPDNVYAPSAIAFNDNHCQPKEMTLDDIEQLKKDFKAAIERAVSIGFDFIEIHNAHGYLLHSFCLLHRTSVPTSMAVPSKTAPV